MKGRTRNYTPTKPALLLGVLVVLLLESIDTTGSVHQALLASIEGVTRRTDLYVHLILCRHSFEPGPACADDLGRHIFGMNPLLHILLQQFGQARVDKAKRGTHEGLVIPLTSHPILSKISFTGSTLERSVPTLFQELRERELITTSTFA